MDNSLALAWVTTEPKRPSLPRRRRRPTTTAT
jgi:hypothetical protein